MKKMTSAKIIATLLVLVMIVGLLPVMSIAAESNVHVLEAKDLEAFAQNDKAQGDTTVVGEYFTINWSEKSKVDTTTNKEWSDGYAIGEEASNRISFGGKSDFAKGGIHTIKFTTEGAATVKVWWVKGDNGRQMALYNESGDILIETEDASAKNAPVLSEMAITAAGTYYLGQTASNYIIKVEVAEEAAEETPSTPAENPLVGTWEAKNGDGDVNRILVLNADGTGTYTFVAVSTTVDITWSYDGAAVTIEGFAACSFDGTNLKAKPQFSWGDWAYVAYSFAKAVETPVEPEQPVEPALPELVDVTELKENTPYYIESIMADGSLYMGSNVTKGRIDGTNDLASAETVKLESAGAEGEYYIYFEIGGVKNYVGATGNGTSKLAISTEKGDGYIWVIDTTAKTILNKTYDTRGLATQVASTYTNVSFYSIQNLGDAGYDWCWLMEEKSSEPEVPAPEAPNADFVAMMDGKYNVNMIMEGLYELTITPDAAGAATGTIVLVDNNQFKLDGTYNYSIAGNQATVTDSTGAETSIIINYNDGKMMFSCKQLPSGSELVKVENEPEQPPVEQNNELVLGNNDCVITDGYSGDEFTFTSANGGTYVLSAAEGETNDFIMLPGSWDPLTLPYTFTLAAGETQTFIMGTGSMEPDTLNLVLAEEGGDPVDPPVEPTTEDLTLTLGDNNVNLKPGVNYTLKLDGVEMFAEYLLTFSDKITISAYGWPMVSGEIQVNSPYTIWTVTVEEEVNEVINLALYVAPPAPELNLGENHVEYTGSEVIFEFTAPEDGVYVFAPMEGETNAFVAIEYGMNMDTMSDTAVEIELAAGETIKIYVSTYDYESDVIDFTLTKKEAEPVDPPKPTTPAEILEAAGNLAEGEQLDGEYTLTGTIIEIVSYSEKYGDVNVYIDVEGTKLYCYGLKGTDLGIDMSKVAVGDTVTVTGVIKNYKGTVEFDKAQVTEYTAVQNPPTGDNATVVMMVAFVALMGMGCVVVLRKKEIL